MWQYTANTACILSGWDTHAAGPGAVDASGQSDNTHACGAVWLCLVAMGRDRRGMAAPLDQNE